jgi:hypothetical protein
MARSLFQRPRETGFAGRYRPSFEEDEYPRRRGESPKWKWPLLVQIIGYLIAAASGVIAAFTIWLVGGAISN